MQLYKKCSTIKVHFLHHSSGRVTEDSTDRKQQDERMRQLLGGIKLPPRTPDTSAAWTLVKLSVVKATIFQLSSLNPV